MLLNSDQHDLQEATRLFARKRLLPLYQEREKEERIDRSLLSEMGGLGLIGADLPERYGGIGASATTSGMLAEELSYGDINVGSVVVVQSLCGGILERNATPDVKDYWLPRVVKGEAVLALSVTEPEAGSDAAALRVKAQLDGNRYVLSGEKNSTTYIDLADAFIVLARTGGPGAKGVTAFLVPADAPGISRTRFADVGNRASGRGAILFDEVSVPVECRVGKEGAGFSEVMSGFDYSRALIALQCIGAAQASIDETWAYVQERQAFGGPIAQFQGVTFPIVESEALLAAARHLAYHTLELHDAGAAHTVESAMVKWFAPKSAFDAIHQCILTFGHYGWSMESPHQQRLRDVMGGEIADGTAGIMKMIVARTRAGRAVTSALRATS